jgi:hypothetical protein
MEINAVVSSRYSRTILKRTGIAAVFRNAINPATKTGLQEINTGIPRSQMNMGKFLSLMLDAIPAMGSSLVLTMFKARINAVDSSSLNSIRSKQHNRRYPPAMIITRRKTIFFLFMREIGDRNNSF